MDGDGLPLSLPLRYVVVKLRPRRRSPNTIHPTLDAIREFYEWAQTREPSFDPEQRLRSGELLSPAEVSSFSGFVRAGGRPDVVAMPGGDQPCQSETGVRSDADFNKRLARVREFLVWAAQEEVAFEPSQRAIDRLRTSFGNELLSEPPTKDRQGISTEQVERLLAAIRPESPDNPFNHTCRFRNWVLIRMLLNTGVRRGELCSVRVNDIIGRAGVAPFVTVKKRLDDQIDPRREIPRIKTREREIPIPKSLHVDCVEYLSRHRGHQFHPFLWAGRRGGAPLGLAAINKLFDRIRRTVFAGQEIDLTPHTMRRTFNDRVWRLCYEKGYAEDKIANIQNYLSGWSVTSKQSAVYSRRAIQQAAMEVAEMMQAKLPRNPAEAPPKPADHGESAML